MAPPTKFSATAVARGVKVLIIGAFLPVASAACVGARLRGIHHFLLVCVFR